MAKISRLAGSTSHVLTLFIQNAAATTGDGLAGLAFGTAGLTCYYKRNHGTASVQVPLVNITTLGTYVSGGFKEIDAVNMPGFYEFHPPDAAMASGSGSVAFSLRGATNMAPCPLEIELTGTDNQDATAGGIARLDAAVSSRMATFALPTNFSALAIAAGTGAVTAGTVTDKTGYGLTAGERSAIAGVVVSDTTDVLGADIVAILGKVNGLTFTGNFLQVDLHQIGGQAAPLDSNNLLEVNAISWGAAGQPQAVDGAVTPSPTAFKVATGLGSIVGTMCIFLTGVLKGQRLQVLGYVPSTGVVTFTAPGFTLGTAATPTAPGVGDTCDFL